MNSEFYYYNDTFVVNIGSDCYCHISFASGTKIIVLESMLILVLAICNCYLRKLSTSGKFVKSITGERLNEPEYVPLCIVWIVLVSYRNIMQY